jgi:transposase
MQRRLRWVELFLKIKNYSVVCLRCGISRPTLRKWVRQFQENGVDGLRAASKRPKSSPAAKVAGKHRDWIRELRNRGLGSRRIQNELKHFYNFEISRATVPSAQTRQPDHPSDSNTRSSARR